MPQALAASPRVSIQSPLGPEPTSRRGLAGSIALTGARFDNLNLTGYREKQDEPTAVELLRPAAAGFGYYAEFGWSGQNLPGLPDAATPWTLASGTALTPTTPVVLTYTSPGGLTFNREIKLDDQFMFTVTDTVINQGAAPVTLTPYSAVRREGVPAIPKGMTASADGVYAILGKPGEYRGPNIKVYRKWAKEGKYTQESTGGWMGFSDKYWLTALIADNEERVATTFTATPAGRDHTFEVRYDGVAQVLNPGAQITESRRLFAGAKSEPLLAQYAESQGIPRFVEAINWGARLFFITKPLFSTIKLFEGWVGNFGIAILMLTVVIKLVFFYPSQLSFASMTKMKKVAPQVEKLKVRYKDDPAAMQQAMMKLYKDEKINPLLGCLPMLATIPVFFALFHVLNTTIEMRHAPFFGWIHDLSARDPTTIWNLFGLIPWDPSTLSIPLIGNPLDGLLHLGVWPLLYGITMLLTQSMSPPATDPTQQMIMRWMPIVFTFIMANFPAGLLIYYCWSNFLTILQQYVLMRRFKVDTPIDAIYRRLTGKPDPAPG